MTSDLKKTIRDLVKQTMKKHRIKNYEFCEYSGLADKKFRRFLSSAKTMDINEAAWVISCLKDMTKEDITLTILINKDKR